MSGERYQSMVELVTDIYEGLIDIGLFRNQHKKDATAKKLLSLAKLIDDQEEQIAMMENLLNSTVSSYEEKLRMADKSIKQIIDDVDDDDGD
jgi:hypothetical protein